MLVITNEDNGAYALEAGKVVSMLTYSTAPAAMAPKECWNIGEPSRQTVVIRWARNRCNDIRFLRYGIALKKASNSAAGPMDSVNNVLSSYDLLVTGRPDGEIHGINRRSWGRRLEE